MKIFTRIILGLVPIYLILSLWIDSLWHTYHLVISVFLIIYSVFVFFGYLKLDKKNFEGVIEFREMQEGSKTFQLIIDKDPNTFQDQDKVTFVLKKIAG